MYEQAIRNTAQPSPYHRIAMVATLLTGRRPLSISPNILALQDCEQARHRPEMSKALFRKGQAHEGLGEMGKAFQDFKKVLHRDPGNRAVIAAMRRCKEQLEQSSGDQAPAVLAVNRLREPMRSRKNIRTECSHLIRTMTRVLRRHSALGHGV